MKYTREQLEKMSDAEINEALHEKRGFSRVQKGCWGSNMVFGVNADGDYIYRDYCNSWEDIMPMAAEYEIDLIQSLYIKLTATTDAEESIKHGLGASGEFYYQDEKPQRAIACVLLMMELNK
jgi:hypothetical protein